MESSKHTTSIIILCFSISILFSSILYLFYHLANTNRGSIAIPAGNTYLGPAQNQPSWTNVSETPKPEEQSPQQSLFTAEAQTPWKIWKGNVFPYQFSYPETLTLTGFPNDKSDAAGFSWGGRKPTENILINIIDLTTQSAFEPYIKKPKKEFVTNWWKQFSGLTGVKPITEFTNKKGLKGYKAQFINTKGETPNVDIFFEVPRDQTRIIRIANGILDPTLFDKIVESVEWKK